MDLASRIEQPVTHCLFELTPTLLDPTWSPNAIPISYRVIEGTSQAGQCSVPGPTVAPHRWHSRMSVRVRRQAGLRRHRLSIGGQPRQGIVKGVRWPLWPPRRPLALGGVPSYAPRRTSTTPQPIAASPSTSLLGMPEALARRVLAPVACESDVLLRIGEPPGGTAAWSSRFVRENHYINFPVPAKSWD